MIKISNLFFKYDKRFLCLYNLNLNFEDETNYTLYSPSELESQVLFRILTKQYKNYKGEIIFNNTQTKNQNVNLKKIKRKNLAISYITKTPYLFQNNSVLFNLILPLKLKKVSSKEAENKAKKILEKYNLNKIANKKIKHLTDEEKFIISLLRAELKNANIIFCDDILNYLSNQKIKELFEKLIKNKQLIIAINNKNNLNYFKNNTIFKFIAE